MLIMDYTMPKETNDTTSFPSVNSFQTNFSSTSGSVASVADFIADCNKTGITGHVPIQIVVMILALPANAILLWLLVKNRKTLSPSEVLGLNFALLGVLYCLSLPQDIIITNANTRSGIPLRIANIFAILSYFGCPLLLSSMCLERYVAVAHPVLFMRLGKWEYRAACSAIIWVLTCIMAVASYMYTISNIALLLSIIVNVLFFVMVGCLFGIVWVLCKKGPGEGDQNSVVKKRALKNIITVLVPSAIIYLPLLAVAPFLLMAAILSQKGITNFLCACLVLLSGLPNFGVCIGPMFYMARIRQMLCHVNNKSGDTRETTTKQRK